MNDDLTPIITNQNTADLPASSDDDNFDPVINENQSMTNLHKKVIALPPEANDSDLIEKEWVTALQDIVAHTSEDPFSQQREISKIKAEYMMIRYNKTIKQDG